MPFAISLYHAAVSTIAAVEEPITPGRRRLIALAMTTAAAMQGMDTFSTAVALPEIRGVMSATADEAAWVLTSFLVAAAIFTPLFAWMSRRFGRRRLLICMIFGFLVCTILVAQSSSLLELVAYRFLQGIAAAGMGPLSNQVLLATYPKEMHGAAFSWLTTGRMSGVMLGPLIGGVLTEYLSWHWVYLCNIPLALFGLWLVIRYVPEATELIGAALRLLRLPRAQRRHRGAPAHARPRRAAELVRIERDHHLGGAQHLGALSFHRAHPDEAQRLSSTRGSSGTATSSSACCSSSCCRS